MATSSRRALEFLVSFLGSAEARRDLEAIGSAGRKGFGDVEKAAARAEGDVDDLGESFEEIVRDLQALGREAKAARDELMRAADVEKRFQSFGRTVRNVVAPLAAFFATREIVDYADTWTEAGNKIAAAAEISGRAARPLSDLNKIASETRSAFEPTVDLYSRLLIATRKVADSEEEVATATELVNKAFKAGGATTQEQTSGILQLSQALRAGLLAGDELKSLQDTAPVILQAIAEEFGAAGDNLKKLGAEGKLTADRVFKAILEAQPKIEAAFAATNLTIGESFTELRNQMIEFVGAANKASGASQLLAGALGLIARNLNIIVPLIALFAAAWGAAAVANVVRDLSAAVAAIKAMIPAMRAAAVAQLAFLGPWGLAAVAIAAVVAGIAHFTGALDPLYEALGLTSKETKKTSDAFKDLEGKVATTKTSILDMPDAAKAAGDGTAKAMAAAAEESRSTWQQALDFIIGDFKTFEGAAKEIFDFLTFNLRGLLKLAREVGKAIASAVTGRAEGGPVGFARGGPVRGPGTSTSDSIPARLSNGEFVMRKRAVDQYGPGFMHAINQGLLDLRDLLGFAGGGLVGALAGSVSAPLVPAAGPGFSAADDVRPRLNTPVILQMPDGKQFQTMADEEIAGALTRYLRGRSLASTRGRRS